MMRMLVATDGSPHALKAAEMAARLARDLREAEVMLVNVGYFPAIAMGAVGLDAVFDLGDLEEGLQQASQAILDQTMHAFGGLDTRVTRVYRRGDLAGEILKTAEEHKADLIIIGCRGLGQIGGLILGSVSERVLHGARIPVLIVR
ncbi:MAG TPA: universal stress protein [bacterium]|nr:universal stress protein [bacterium]